MFGRILGRSPDHPLESKTARRELPGELSRMAPLAALDEISAYLDAVKTADELRPARALEIVAFLNALGEPLQRQLTKEYLGTPAKLTKFQQGRLWTGTFTYWTQLAEAYRCCLAKWQVGASGALVLKPHMPEVICGALRARAGQLKWTLLRHGSADARLWREIHDLYRIADQLAVTQKRCPIAGEESTADHEFMCATVLAISSPDAMLAPQIDLAERIIAQLAPHFRLSERPEDGSLHIVNLSSQEAPGRISVSVNGDDDLRWLALANAALEVGKMIQSIDKNNATPDQLQVMRDVDPVLLQATLRHLSRCWSMIPMERKQPRRRSTELLTVVHEFDEVAASVGGLFLDSPFVSNEEEWVVENESYGGFGVFVSHTQGAWLRIGSAIGVRRHEGAAWGAGVVRRITLDEKGNRYVGIEMLASGGSAVTIRSASLSAKGGSISARGELCVLLGSGEASKSEVTLLMRANLFSSAQSLLMQAYDRQYLLLAGALVERGDEFDLARYRIVEQERNAA